MDLKMGFNNANIKVKRVSIKAVMTGLFFMVMIFALFEYVDNFSFFHLASNLYQPQNFKGFLKSSVYIGSYFFILFNFLLLMLMKKTKLLYIIVGFFTLFFLVDWSYYLNGLGRGFSIDQFIVATNESKNIYNAISTFYAGAIKSLLLLIIMYVTIFFTRKIIFKRFFILPLFFLPFSFIGANMIFNGTTHQIYNYPSFIKVPLTVYNAYHSGYMNIPFVKRKSLSVLPKEKPHYKNIIMIVDESIRGDYLSINGYMKKTTPYLDSLKNIVNLGCASSVANASASSNYILRNGIVVDELPDKNYTTLEKPSIFQFAKNAGYKTIFMDAQAFYKSLQNYMSVFDLESIDKYLTLRNRDDYSVLDRTMIKKLSDILNNSQDSHFVYLVKYGSHFKWQLNYPKSNTIFKPELTAFESLSFDHRDRAVNTYLNSINWSVDKFYEYLLKNINMDNTLIIHTSDHGQNIVENDLLITHGLANNPPSEMATVPLFFYSNDIEYIKNKFGQIKYDKYSQYQIFPSLLDLMGYGEDVVSKYGITFWDGLADNRKFFSGYIFGEGSFNKYTKPISSKKEIK